MNSPILFQNQLQNHYPAPYFVNSWTGQSVFLMPYPFDTSQLIPIDRQIRRVVSPILRPDESSSYSPIRAESGKNSPAPGLNSSVKSLSRPPKNNFSKLVDSLDPDTLKLPGIRQLIASSYSAKRLYESGYRPPMGIHPLATDPSASIPTRNDLLQW